MTLDDASSQRSLQSSPHGYNQATTRQRQKHRLAKSKASYESHTFLTFENKRGWDQNQNPAGEERAAACRPYASRPSSNRITVEASVFVEQQRWLLYFTLCIF